MSQVCESETGPDSGGSPDGLVGPKEDAEDTGHIQVRAENGVVVADEPAEVHSCIHLLD